MMRCLVPIVELPQWLSAGWRVVYLDPHSPRVHGPAAVIAGDVVPERFRVGNA